MFKKFLAGILMLTLVLGLTACNDEPEENSTPTDQETGDTTSEMDPDEPVALVNGEEILAKEWQMMSDSIASQQFTQMQQMGINPQSEKGKQYVKEIETRADDMALEQLIQQEAVLQEAQNNHYSVESETVQTKFAETKAKFDTVEAFENALEQNDFTAETYRESIEKQLLTQQYLDDKMEPVELTDEQVKVAYEEYKTKTEEQSQELKSFEELKDPLREKLIKDHKNAQIQTIVQTVMDTANIERLI
jgi:hypothetical protein